MGVSNGQPVDAANTNPAFINKNIDDIMPNMLGFSRALSGLTIADAQAAINKLYSATGASEVASGTMYGAPASTIIDGTSHRTALVALADKFDPSTGHKHSGTAGDGPAIPAANIGAVPLHGYAIKGTDIVGAVGFSTDVSSLMVGYTPSSGSTSLGVVVQALFNKGIVRNTFDQQILDTSGNVVYSRITWAGSVWTLTYFTEVAGVETPFSMPSQTVRWYFQALFNPLNGAPVYSDFANIPSNETEPPNTVQEISPTGMADGTITDFALSQVTTVKSSTYVFTNTRISEVSFWNLVQVSGVTKIRFTTAPAAGTEVYIIYNATLGGVSPSIGPTEPHGSFSAPVAVTPSVGIVPSSANDQVMWVTPVSGGPGAIPITSTPQFAPGSEVGQRLTVFGVTNGSGGFLSIADGNGVLQNGTFSMITGQCIVYMWNGGVWQFVSNAI